MRSLGLEMTFNVRSDLLERGQEAVKARQPSESPQMRSRLLFADYDTRLAGPLICMEISSRRRG